MAPGGSEGNSAEDLEWPEALTPKLPTNRKAQVGGRKTKKRSYANFTVAHFKLPIGSDDTLYGSAWDRLLESENITKLTKFRPSTYRSHANSITKMLPTWREKIFCYVGIVDFNATEEKQIKQYLTDTAEKLPQFLVDKYNQTDRVKRTITNFRTSSVNRDAVHTTGIIQKDYMDVYLLCMR